MKNKSLTCNVPERRFPEFVNDGEWKEKTLKGISPAIFDGTHQTPTYTEAGIPFFSVENIVSGNKNKFISKEDYLVATSKNKPEKDDILLTRIGKIGFSTIVDWDYEFSIYVTLAVIKKSDKFNSYFLHSFFQSAYYQKEILKKSLLNAVPCKINMDELRKTKILLPSPNEQQKIADCLSSIDNLIAAQSKKVEALKEHKKGLMQQLFPTDGEEVPKLRFPEFKNAPKWEENKLGSKEICNSLSSGKDKNDPIGKFDLYGSTGIIGKSLNDSYDGNFILVARVGANAGFLTKANGKFGITDNTLVIDLNKEINADFIFSSLERFGLNKLIFGSGQPLITGGQLKAISIFLPKPKEQQKIANFLSSIDELITSSTKKLQTLKEHKKALMQQLFPSKEVQQ